MSLHLKWGIKLFVAMFTLCEVTKVNILLFAAVYMTLDVHHGLDIVVQHFITIPALQTKK
jgi:hypothetical protein